MLFDLRGRRRRLVQVTYLMLALLMGGGLVLFGIGGDVSGGLFDAFTGDGGGGAATRRPEAHRPQGEARCRRTRRTRSRSKALVRDNYQLATGQDAGATAFPADAKDDLRKAAALLAALPRGRRSNPNASLALCALRVYDVGALNQPKEARAAARSWRRRRTTRDLSAARRSTPRWPGTSARPTSPTQKAVDLAPKNQKKVKKQVEAAEARRQQAQQPSG